MYMTNIYIWLYMYICVRVYLPKTTKKPFQLSLKTRPTKQPTKILPNMFQPRELLFQPRELLFQPRELLNGPIFIGSLGLISGLLRAASKRPTSSVCWGSQPAAWKASQPAIPVEGITVDIYQTSSSQLWRGDVLVFMEAASSNIAFFVLL